MVFALTFVYNIALYTLVLVIPLYLRFLGVTPMVLGLAVSLPPMVQLIMRLPSGAVSDRLGERVVLMTSVFTMLLAASLFWAALYLEATALVVGALLLSGLSRAIYWPSAQSYASRAVTGGDATRVLGLFTSIGYLGAILATPLAGLLMVRGGFVAGFQLIMAASAVGLLLAWHLRRGRLSAPGREIAATAVAEAPARPGAATGASSGAAAFFRSLGAMARTRGLLFSGLCMTGAAVPMAMLSSFFPVYVADLGLRADAIGLLASSRSITATLSSFAMGVAGARLPGVGAWIAGAGLCGLSITATAYLSSFWGLAGAMSLAGISSGLLQVLSMTIVVRSSTAANRAQAMAFTGIFFSLALWFVPLLLGVMIEFAGFRTAFAVLGASWLVLTVVLAGPARHLAGAPQQGGGTQSTVADRANN